MKFHIIRVWRGCSPKEILWLNDVFDIHRNAAIIKRIKKHTDDYNVGLKAKADSLMQNNLQIRKANRIVDIRLLKEEKISPPFYSLYKNIYYICKQSDDIYGKPN